MLRQPARTAFGGSKGTYSRLYLLVQTIGGHQHPLGGSRDVIRAKHKQKGRGGGGQSRF